CSEPRLTRADALADRQIGGDIRHGRLVDPLCNGTHLIVLATPGSIIAELFVDSGAGLTVEVREIGGDRNPVLPVTGEANLLHGRASPTGVRVSEDTQQLGRPDHLRYGCCGRIARGLPLSRRSGQEPERAADGG